MNFNWLIKTVFMYRKNYLRVFKKRDHARTNHNCMHALKFLVILKCKMQSFFWTSLNSLVHLTSPWNAFLVAFSIFSFGWIVFYLCLKYLFWDSNTYVYKEKLRSNSKLNIVECKKLSYIIFFLMTWSFLCT